MFWDSKFCLASVLPHKKCLCCCTVSGTFIPCHNFLFKFPIMLLKKNKADLKGKKKDNEISFSSSFLYLATSSKIVWKANHLFFIHYSEVWGYVCLLKF